MQLGKIRRYLPVTHNIDKCSWQRTTKVNYFNFCHCDLCLLITCLRLHRHGGSDFGENTWHDAVTGETHKTYNVWFGESLVWCNIAWITIWDISLTCIILKSGGTR